MVAEINNGGEMVAEVLRQSEPHLPVRSVNATRGKFLRAEPIAAAYERGLIFHAGTFVKLEDQLCALTPDFDRRAAGFSPDRADALVWALADLLGSAGERGGMMDYYSGGGRGEKAYFSGECNSAAHEVFDDLTTLEPLDIDVS